MYINELVKNPEECCGCGACSVCCPQSAITMAENAEGFLFPCIDESVCINCGKCIRVCGYKKAELKISDKKTYAAFANDVDLKQSASGGVFSSLAQAVLDAKGVVFGCAMLYENGKLIPKHISVTEKKDLIKLKGSKYVQSDAACVFQEVKLYLQSQKIVMFSGTPCQIMGLKGYLQKEYDNLYTVEIVCHGVPSLKMFHDYIDYIENITKKHIINFKFRDKSQGWKLHGKMVLEDENGIRTEQYFEPEESSYYQMFLKSYTYRKNCYSCPFASEYRQGDITIGDYWCIDLVHPEYMIENDGKIDEGQGASCLITNNSQGEKLIEKYGQGIEIWKSSYEQASRYNAQLRQPSFRKNERAIVFELQKQGYKEIEKWYQKKLAKIKFIRKIRSMIPKWIKKFLREKFLNK